MVRRLEGLIFDHRMVVVILFGAATLVMAWFAMQLRVDAGFTKHLPLNHPYMQTFVEYSDEFGNWWEMLDEDEQDSIAVSVLLLEQKGASLPFPYSSAIEGSKHSHMRELRIQHKGNPYRVLYAFDPRRVSILLIGGNKAGQDRWYTEYIPKADKLYDDHIQLLKKEGLI